jgi:hypothetical protein
MCTGCMCVVGCECWRYKSNEACKACGFYAYEPEHKRDACSHCGRPWDAPGHAPKAEALPLTADEVRRIVREELANAQFNVTYSSTVFDSVEKVLAEGIARGTQSRRSAA